MAVAVPAPAAAAVLLLFAEVALLGVLGDGEGEVALLPDPCCSMRCVCVSLPSRDLFTMATPLLEAPNMDSTLPQSHASVTTHASPRSAEIPYP